MFKAFRLRLVWWKWFLGGPNPLIMRLNGADKRSIQIANERWSRQEPTGGPSRVIVARSKAKEVSLSAVVTRCRCGNPDGHRGAVCPQGVTEELGTISYWSHNPFKRLAYWFQRSILNGRVEL